MCDFFSGALTCLFLPGCRPSIFLLPKLLDYPTGTPEQALGTEHVKRLMCRLLSLLDQQEKHMSSIYNAVITDASETNPEPKVTHNSDSALLEGLTTTDTTMQDLDTRDWLSHKYLDGPKLEGSPHQVFLGVKSRRFQERERERERETGCAGVRIHDHHEHTETSIACETWRMQYLGALESSH